MVNLSNKKNKGRQHSQAQIPDVDFINYATHFNRKTILTKNGELLQIIRITGLSEGGDQEDSVSLRDRIRDTIYDNMGDNNEFSFWFHTIRRKKDVTTKKSNGYDNFLTKEIDDKWNEGNEWSNKYVNELYITIISQSCAYLQGGIGASFTRHFSYKSATKHNITNLKILEKELSIFVSKVQMDLIDSGAKILKIAEWDGQYYSEPMRFLGKIVNLKEDRYPLTFNDLSSDLANSRIVFGTRDVQVINNKKSHFCAILSLKEYIEIPLELMDKILNLNFEFIITQSFDLFSDEKQLKNYKSNLDILEGSGDESMKEISGLSQYEDHEKRSKKDFGSLQTTITIISDDHEKLEEEIASALEEFGTLGLIMVREDVFLEHCYWSRLPGNFTFLKRQKTIKTLKVPGFSAITSFPTGSYDGNRWGPAVTTLKTIIDTPYFFNFHTYDSGNTIIQGPKESDKNIFTNFLLCQAYKLDCNIYFIDSHNSSKALTKCLGGDYYEIDPESQEEDAIKLNPFSLDAGEENTKFIQDLFTSMTKFLRGADVGEEISNSKAIISSLLRNGSANFLVAFDSLRSNETKELYEKLKIWATGKLSYIFDAQDELDWNKKITGFDFSTLIEQKPIIIPIFQYILHRIFAQAKNSGTPAIIVIDEPVEFLDNPVLEEKFSELCKLAYEANSILVLKNSNSFSSKNTELIKSFFENCNTQIIYPGEKDAQIEPYNTENFLLDEGEIGALSYMASSDQNTILLKKEDIPVILKPELEHISKYRDILSCAELTKVSVNEIIANNPQLSNDPKALTKEILNIVSEIKKAEREEIEAKIQKQIEKSERDD